MTSTLSVTTNFVSLKAHVNQFLSHSSCKGRIVKSHKIGIRVRVIGTWHLKEPGSSMPKYGKFTKEKVAKFDRTGTKYKADNRHLDLRKRPAVLGGGLIPL